MEIFGFKQYRNVVDDPWLASMSQRVAPRDFCACGLNATGDEPALADTAQDVTEDVTPAGSLQGWRYARTALMLIGLYVVGKFVYDKFAK